MNPQASVNFRPTYYYNVYSVETTEYVEPKSLDVEQSLMLGVQIISRRDREVIWAIESSSKFRRDLDQMRDYSVYITEANAIAEHMLLDGLIVK